MRVSDLLYQAELTPQWVNEFIVNSNLIDPQPGSSKPGSLVYDGHLDAVLYAIQMAANDCFALPNAIHKLLLRDHPLAGKLRTQDVKIGLNFTLLPSHVPYFFWCWNKEVKRTIDFFRKGKGFGEALKPMELWALHCEFENIRPYELYNGKVGRVLLLNHALLVNTQPWFIPFARREDYFDLIRHHVSAEWALIKASDLV